MPSCHILFTRLLQCVFEVITLASTKVLLWQQHYKIWYMGRLQGTFKGGYVLKARLSKKISLQYRFPCFLWLRPLEYKNVQFEVISQEMWPDCPTFKCPILSNRLSQVSNFVLEWRLFSMVKKVDQFRHFLKVQVNLEFRLYETAALQMLRSETNL